MSGDGDEWGMKGEIGPNVTHHMQTAQTSVVSIYFDMITFPFTNTSGHIVCPQLVVELYKT